jgi:Mg/Co/Ni transporter MgtE
MDQTKVEVGAKVKLGLLSKALDKTISEAIDEMAPEEVTYILENYAKFLTYDLKRNFEEKREKDLKESPFDAIINDNLGNE